MAETNEQLEQLRQAVIGNRRGREVEVDPTGEIRIPHESDDEENSSDIRRLKPSKMSKHTFGA